jgi:hypothetical protein
VLEWLQTQPLRPPWVDRDLDGTSSQTTWSGTSARILTRTNLFSVLVAMALGTLGMDLRETLDFPALGIHGLSHRYHSWVVFLQAVRYSL